MKRPGVSSNIFLQSWKQGHFVLWPIPFIASSIIMRNSLKIYVNKLIFSANIFDTGQQNILSKNFSYIQVRFCQYF